MRRFALCLTLAAVFLVGCGDEEDDTVAAASTTEADASETTDATESSDTTEASSEDDETDTTVEGDEPEPETTLPDFSGEDSEEFCASAQDYSAKFENAFDTEDPAAVGDNLEAANLAVQDLAGKAPDEIQPDVETVSAAFQQLIGALEDVDYDFTRIDPEAASALDDPEITAANDRVEAYLSDVCGIE